MLSDNTNGSRTPRLIAGVIAAVCVVIGVVTFAVGHGNEETSDHSDDDSFDVATAPSQLTWTAHKGIELPYTPVAGPTGNDSGAPVGYAHTPQGAAMAAINTPVRIAVADDALWPDLVRITVAPGAGRDAFAVNRVQVSIQGNSDPQTRPRIRGYHISEYSPEQSIVDVFTSYSDASVASTRIHVLWRDDDWKVVLPDPADPDLQPVTRSLESLPDDRVVVEAPE